MIRLRQNGGAHDGRVVQFHEGPVRMGRMPDSEVPLDAHKDLDVSGRHAEIIIQSSHWVVVDCGSRNGTFINGERIGRQIVSSGDQIQLGEDGAVFTVEEASVDLSLAKTQATPSGIPVSASPSPPASTPTPPPEHARWAPPPFALPDAATGPLTPAIDAVIPPAAVPTPAPVSSNWGVPPQSAQPPVQSTSQPQSYGMPSGSDGSLPASGPVQPTVGELTKAAVSSGETPTALKAGVALIATLFGLASIILLVAVLSRSPTPDPARVAAANQEALLQLVGRIGGQDAPFCTAFAVRPSLLATSARCVLEIEQRQRGGAFVEVIQGTQRFRVSRLWRHPEFDVTTGAADVGLVEVDRTVPLVVNLGRAGDDHLVALGYSFQGLVATPLVVDTDGDLIRHDVSLPSGAPLLDATGAVVGIHSAAPGWGDGVGQATAASALESLLAGLPE